jgi:HemY protein
MARAMRAAGDPAWTADGTVSEHWRPVSPSGRLDGYAWKVPLAEIGMTRPVIEMTPPKAPVESLAVAPPAPEPDAKPAVRKSVKSAAKPAPKTTPKTKPVEPVIPLVHAPDDPGPDLHLDADPVPEPTTPPPRAPWQRFMQLFR